jgi:hypothetical protein
MDASAERETELINGMISELAHPPECDRPGRCKVKRAQSFPNIRDLQAHRSHLPRFHEMEERARGEEAPQNPSSISELSSPADHARLSRHCFQVTDPGRSDVRLSDGVRQAEACLLIGRRSARDGEWRLDKA